MSVFNFLLLRKRGDVLPLPLSLVLRPLLAAMFVLLLPLANANAAGEAEKRVQAKPIKRLFSATDIFDRKFKTGNVIDVDVNQVIAVPNEEFAAIEGKHQPAPDNVAPPSNPEKQSAAINTSGAPAGLTFVSNNPNDEPILPPDQTPAVRVNPEAPSPIKGMISAMRKGDSENAEAYADQFVRLQKNFFFEVREIVRLIGEALVRQEVIDDDQWVGAEDLMNIEMARTRKEMGVLLKPDQDTAMQRIEPDARGEAHVYYFFSLNCSYCRLMAPDVERLWRISKQDPRLKFQALVIGSTPESWLDDYRQYTGLSLPVYDGEDVARKLKIGFLPALVIVAPGTGRAYLKTGQQSFANMYQFLRRVQGLPPAITEEVKTIIATPIGQAEEGLAVHLAKVENKGEKRARLLNVQHRKEQQTVVVERF